MLYGICSSSFMFTENKNRKTALEIKGLKYGSKKMKKVISIIILLMLTSYLLADESKLIKKINYRANGEISGYILYEYNDNNLIEYEKRFRSDNRLIGYINYFYINDRLIKRENHKVVKAGDSRGAGIYDKDEDILLGYDILKYDENEELLIREESYFGDGVMGEEILYKYNNIGEVISEEHINRAPNNRAQVRNYILRFIYDESFLYRTETYENDEKQSYSYRIYERIPKDKRDYKLTSTPSQKS